MSAVSFTKLFSSITASTIWTEPSGTRLTWITMLAMADHAGRVSASIPGLAHIARVTLQECQSAIDTFLAPDRYSRTEDYEGRRIERIAGGWRLLNYGKFRDMRDEESAREAKRKYMENRRRKAREKTIVNITTESIQINKKPDTLVQDCNPHSGKDTAL